MNCANHPERERVAFCQNCGKPLCQECTRAVGAAVFCEPCLVTKLAGAGTGTNSSGGYTGAPGEIPFGGAGVVPPPPVRGDSNPGLAALLGFIPGVGAMYNGQYAKGVVHLIVFAILVSLSNENGIFGLFIAGWVIYQVMEAYQTATARRDGTPLPNPFGLNDLGERLGFGKAWPGSGASGVGVGSAGSAAGSSASAGDVAGRAVGEAAGAGGTAVGWETAGRAGAQGWAGYGGAPVAPGTPGTPGTPGAAPYAGAFVPPVAPPYGAAYSGGAYPNAPYPVDPVVGPASNRFPSGAIWLIGLGCLFLIGNAGIFHGFPVHRLLPVLLIGIGVWLFVHKMTETGTLADDGTPAYRYRLFAAVRGSIWIVLVGVLFALDTFGILSWGHSWPLFIIVAGLIAFFRRMSYPAAPPYPYPYAAGNYGAPVAPPPASAPVPPVVPPSNQHDQEGS